MSGIQEKWNDISENMDLLQNNGNDIFNSLSTKISTINHDLTELQNNWNKTEFNITNLGQQLESVTKDYKNVKTKINEAGKSISRYNNIINELNDTVSFLENREMETINKIKKEYKNISDQTSKIFEYNTTLQQLNSTLQSSKELLNLTNISITELMQKRDLFKQYRDLNIQYLNEIDEKAEIVNEKLKSLDTSFVKGDDSIEQMYRAIVHIEQNIKEDQEVLEVIENKNAKVTVMIKDIMALVDTMKNQTDSDYTRVADKVSEVLYNQYFTIHSLILFYIIAYLPVLISSWCSSPRSSSSR